MAHALKENETLGGGRIMTIDVITPKIIDRLVGVNLKRMRVDRGITQDHLGRMVQSGGVVIAQVEGAIRGMGKSLQARLCNALECSPCDFYLEERTPIVRSRGEMEALEYYRIAEAAGVTSQWYSFLKYLTEAKGENGDADKHRTS